MTFASLIDDLREEEHQIVIYRGDDPLEIETWLAEHGVAVECHWITSDGPDPFIEIKTGSEVIGTIRVDAVEGLLEPPIDRPGDRDGVSEGYGVLFELLEKTVFSGMARRDFLAVSREIEDRAYRVGEGTLWASFQTLSTFKSQAEVYRILCTETSLNVHIYGVDDWSPPLIPGVTYHTESATRFEPYWILAYDGGSDRSQACGLVAQEENDEYTGFWTNDPQTVETISNRFWKTDR